MQQHNFKTLPLRNKEMSWMILDPILDTSTP